MIVELEVANAREAAALIRAWKRVDVRALVLLLGALEKLPDDRAKILALRQILRELRPPAAKQP